MYLDSSNLKILTNKISEICISPLFFNLIILVSFIFVNVLSNLKSIFVRCYEKKNYNALSNL